MQLKDLKQNKSNPRRITEKRRKTLISSLAKFGDLSGFVYNVRSQSLIGGNQKHKVLPPDAKIKIEVKHKEPTAARTVAEGYVLVDGERFKYREVDADKVWETEAMLAANNHAGEWDADLLRVVLHDVPEIDIGITGFEIEQLRNLNIEMPEVNIARVEIESKGEAAPEESDEQYVKNTPKTTEQIDQERVPPVDGETKFDSVKEKTEIAGKRFVIIVDCPSQEIKESLREKLQPEITQAGCKIF